MTGSAARGDVRVADVIPRLQLRGGEVQAQHLANERASRSPSRLFTLWGDGVVAAVDGLDIQQGPLTGGRRTVARALRANMRDFAPSVIVAYGGEPLRAAVRAHLDRIAPIVYVRISAVPPRLRRGIRGRVLRHAYAQVTSFIAVSRSLADELVDDFGVDPARVTVIHNARPRPAPLDSQRRSALRAEFGADLDDVLVTWVGGLVAEKDPEAVPRLARRVAPEEPTVRFAMIGDGPIVIDPGPVHLEGPRSDVAEVIAASDILLSTSTTEGLPGVMVEASLAGVPIVAPDVGGISEIVGETSGILVPPGDEPALANAIVLLARDPSLRARFAAGATERSGDFEIGAVGKAFDAVLLDALRSER